MLSQENIESTFPLDDTSTTSSLGESTRDLSNGGIFNYDADAELDACNKFLKDSRPKRARRSNHASWKRKRHAQLKNDPEYRRKIRCRDNLGTAVRSGKIKKPKKCSTCNKVSTNLSGHHEDYNKPYDIIWVCCQCHSDIHKKQITK